MAKQSLRVCIIVPALNEGAIIKSVLKSLPKTARIKGRHVTYEPVVIDDGSTDNTYVEASKVRGVVVLRHSINLGAGGGTRTGLRYARDQGYALALTMDADGQHAPEDASKLVRYMLAHPEVDLLIGSRLRDKGDMSLLVKSGNIALNYITLILLGAYVSDSQSGMRVFSTRALAKLEYHSNNYAFCSEMLWQAKRSGLRIAECPIRAIYTEHSKTKKSGQKNFSGALKILQELVGRRIMELLHE